MSDYDDLDNGPGLAGGGFGGGTGQGGDRPGDAYFRVRTDGPFAGWNQHALDNLKASLSQKAYGDFLLDRVGAFGANNMSQDPNDAPAQFTLHYDPADYGAPPAEQPDKTAPPAQQGG